MAYSPLGYSYPTAPQFLMTPSSLPGCVDAGTPPSHSALRSSSHQLATGTGIGVYSGSYPKSQSYYNTSDATALYSRGALDPKDGVPSVHVGTPQTPAYYPYEYTFGQYPYERYSYSCSDGASRRKNATRETTSTLKAWLQEHQKNPYPTKGEKIMLAIITRMTLTQVSTWFANARRRLKKENKVTWSPRACKSSDDRACDGDDDTDEAEKPHSADKDRPGEWKPNPSLGTSLSQKAPADQSLLIDADQQCTDLQSDLEDFDLLESDASECEPKPQYFSEDNDASESTELTPRHLTDQLRGEERLSPDCPEVTAVQHQNGAFYPTSDLASPNSKPKIWSIAHTAVSLNAGLQEEYPSCMLSSTGSSSPGYPSSMALTKADGQQESPVATLREWVDGVFHGPPFTQPRPAELWKGLNDAVIGDRTSGQSFELVRPTSSL